MVPKQLRNEGNAFALQTDRPLGASDDHVKWRSVSTRRRKSSVLN